MESKDHARIHTGRNDRNRRPSGSRRRTALVCTSTAAFGQTQGLKPWQRFAVIAARADQIVSRSSEAEAGHQGLDGVHPLEAAEVSGPPVPVAVPDPPAEHARGPDVA
jgi:hypothetical protein